MSWKPTPSPPLPIPSPRPLSLLSDALRNSGTASFPPGIMTPFGPPALNGSFVPKPRPPPIPLLIFSPACLAGPVPELPIRELFVVAGPPREDLGREKWNHWQLWCRVTPIPPEMWAADEADTGTRDGDDQPGEKAPPRVWPTSQQGLPKQTIVVEMIPNGGPGELEYTGHKGMIVVSSLMGVNTPVYTKNVACSAAMDVKPGLTVRELLDSLFAGKLERYEFTPKKRGGRAWVLQTIRYLEKIGTVVHPEQVAEAAEAMEEAYELDGHKDYEKAPIRFGKFY